jgi:hypothetical protein
MKQSILFGFLISFSFSLYAQVSYQNGQFYGVQSGTYHSSSMGALYSEQMHMDNQLFNMQMSQRMQEQQNRNTQFYQDQMNQRMENFTNNMVLMQRMQMIIQRGKAIIKSGKADNTFKPDPQFSLTKVLLQQVKTNEDREMVTKHTASYLNLYRKRIESEGFQQNNLPDAASLGFVLNFEIYTGIKPSATHLKTLKTTTTKAFLASEYFQGLSDSDKQLTYEKYGALTMYALELSKSSDPLKLKEAKQIAGAILEYLFSRPANQIVITPTAFEWKGTWLIKNGKATTDFRYADITPEEFDKLIKEFQLNSLSKEKILLYISEFEKEVAKKGGQKNDLAYALATAIHGAYYVYSNGKEFNDKQFAGVLSYAKNKVLTTPELQALDDEAKQKLYLRNVIAITDNLSRYVSNKQNGWNDLVKSNQETALSYLKNYFSPDDFTKMQLGENGFEKK